MEYEPTVYDDSRGGGWDFDPEVLQVMPELLRFDPYKNYYRGGIVPPFYAWAWLSLISSSLPFRF